MPTFEIWVYRGYATAVSVDADNGQAAIELVNTRDFPLPPIEQWQGQKDWLLRAFDEHGDEVADSDT